MTKYKFYYKCFICQLIKTKEKEIHNDMHYFSACYCEKKPFCGICGKEMSLDKVEVAE